MGNHPYGRQARRAVNLRSRQADRNLPDHRIVNAWKRRDGAYFGPETMPRRMRTRDARVQKALNEWND